jgi:hypothetical protein
MYTGFTMVCMCLKACLGVCIFYIICIYLLYFRVEKKCFNRLTVTVVFDRKCMNLDHVSRSRVIKNPSIFFNKREKSK